MRILCGALRAGLALAALSAASQAPPPGRGAIVEEPRPGSPAEAAGLRAGDSVIGWARQTGPGAPASGAVRSPFELLDVELEQAPRGTVELQLEREGRRLELAMPAPPWALRSRPALSPEALAAHREARGAQEKGQPQEAAEAWRREALRAEAAGDWLGAAWLFLSAADALAVAGRWDEAHAVLRAAADAARESGEARASAAAREAAGRLFQSRNELAEAEKAFRDAVLALEQLSEEGVRIASGLCALGNLLERRGELAAAETELRRCLKLRETLTPEAVELGAALRQLGRVVGNRGDLAAEEPLLRRAQALLERVAPDSLPLADVVNNLAVNHARRGQLDAAEELFRRNLALHEKLDPGTLPYALAVFNLGNMAYARGDLISAQGYYETALSIREKLAPNGPEVAQVVNNLGSIAASAGDLEAAEGYFQRALAIWEGRAPDSPLVADLIHNLGTLALDRGELDVAEERLRRALAVKERRSPGSLEVASTLANLGNLLRDRGRFEEAEAAQRRALAIREEKAGAGPEIAVSLDNLAELAEARGDLAAAEAFLGRAVSVSRERAPGGLTLAASLHRAGALALAQGRLEQARASLSEALAIRERLAPGSFKEAETLLALGRQARRAGEKTVAAEFLRRALVALESQVGRLGGSEQARLGFGARHAEAYEEYVDLLIELKRPDEAFHALERGRARSLLALLAERKLVFAADVPLELESRRRLADVVLERTQAALNDLRPDKDAVQIEALRGRIAALRAEREEIAARIRKASPRLAQLNYPQPLEVAAARAALDPGTVLLAYSLGRERSHLFVLPAAGRGGLAVHGIAAGEAALRERVDAFRRLLDRRGGLSPAGVGAARELYDLLVRPAEARLGPAARVVISPDGPLHALPFGALMRTGEGGRPSHLVEWKPLHVVVSATLFAELKGSRRPAEAEAAGPVLAAFGDPAYAAAGEAVPARAERAARLRGRALEPLPSTRDEVQAIASLFPARTFLGAEATEARAKALGKSLRYVHFACHGVLDERQPLQSALVLSTQATGAASADDGVLEAWEVFEKVRLAADLVALSACETGLGGERGGEGLVGLTRSFLYAGARSVLASLWGVSDASTSALMKSFYGHLRAGDSKDTALQKAQLAMIHGPAETSAPFHWAAFQLAGDWR